MPSTIARSASTQPRWKLRSMASRPRIQGSRLRQGPPAAFASNAASSWSGPTLNGVTRTPRRRKAASSPAVRVVLPVLLPAPASTNLGVWTSSKPDVTGGSPWKTAGLCGVTSAAGAPGQPNRAGEGCLGEVCEASGGGRPDVLQLEPDRCLAIPATHLGAEEHIEPPALLGQAAVVVAACAATPGDRLDDAGSAL